MITGIACSTLRDGQNGKKHDAQDGNRIVQRAQKYPALDVHTLVVQGVETKFST